MSDTVIRRIVLHLPPVSPQEAHTIARDAGERIARSVRSGSIAVTAAIDAVPHEPGSLLSRRIAASVLAGSKEGVR